MNQFEQEFVDADTALGIFPDWAAREQPCYLTVLHAQHMCNHGSGRIVIKGKQRVEFRFRAINSEMNSEDFLISVFLRQYTKISVVRWQKRDREFS
jgi:hypothetical protein